MSKKALTISALALLAGVSMSGCAGVAAGTTASQSNAPKVEKVQAMVPEAIKARGKLLIATDATAGVPFSSFDVDNKTIVGLAPDLAHAVAETMGLEAELVNTPFDTLIPGLEGQRYDMSASTMLDTPKRRAVISFVDFMEDGSGFLAKAGYEKDNITLESICGVTVGVLRGSFEEAEMTKASATHCAGDPADIKIFDTKANNRLALENGRVDVVSESIAQVAYYAKASKGKFKDAGEPYGEALIGIGLPKDSALTLATQAALQELMDSGRYAEIMKSYGLEETMLQRPTINGE